MKILYFLIIIIIVFTSCSTCEDQTEPKLNVDFHINGLHYYSSCYGIGSHDSIHDYSELPLAINSDTSIFVFIDSLNTDTLAISYKRNIRYQSEGCGFTIELESFNLLDISTFDSVSFETSSTSFSYPSKSNKNEYTINIYH
jgi:hypothetical protein